MLVSGHTSQANDRLMMIMMVWLKRPKSQGSHTQTNGQAPGLLLLFTPHGRFRPRFFYRREV